MPDTNPFVSGAFSVDGDGAACYSIPLQLPPGINGMQPTLSLDYNSSRGLNSLGVGWTLTGLSTITRVPATQAQDGRFGGVKFNANDCFALDGQRLINMSQPLPDGSPVYRTEIDSGLIAVPTTNSSVTGGPISWQVFSQDGRCTEYGMTADSRCPVSSQSNAVQYWAVNRVTDLCGNQYNVTYNSRVDYTDASGTKYSSIMPAKITYGDRSVATTSSPLQRIVLFTYVDATTPLFPVKSFMGGIGTMPPPLLKSITTQIVQPSPLSPLTCLTWSFTYETSVESGRQRLTQVTCPTGPVTVQYNEAAANPLGNFTLIAGIDVPQGGSLVPVDLDGDGLVDLVVVGNSGLIAYRNNGSLGFQQIITWNTDIGFIDVENCTPIDVDGDGTTEFLVPVLPAGAASGFGDTNPNSIVAGQSATSESIVLSVAVYQLKPVCNNGNWSFQETQLQNIPPGNYIPADLTGSGMLDLVIAQQLPYASQSLSGSSETAPQPEPGTPLIVPAFSRLVSSGGSLPTPGYAMWSQFLWSDFSMSGDNWYIPMDLDGDGRTDLTLIRHMGNDADTTVPAIKMLLSNVDSPVIFNDSNWTDPFEVVRNSTSDANQLHGFRFMPLAGDINGDGVEDIVWLFFESPNIYIWRLHNTAGAGLQFYDAPTTTTKLNVGGGATVDDTNPTDSYAQLFLMDVDGDGAEELVSLASMGNDMTWFQVFRLNTPTVTQIFNKILPTPGSSSFQPIINPLVGTVGDDGGPWEVGFVPADLVGSGKVGVIYQAPNGAVGYFYTGGLQPDLPLSITNEIGGTVQITYAPLTDPSVYSMATCAQCLPQGLDLSQRALIGKPYAPGQYPAPSGGNRDVPGSIGSLKPIEYPRYVVSGYTRLDGRGGSYANQCFYSGARVDLGGHGWLGFDAVRMADLSAGIVRETSAGQIFPFTGTVLCTSQQTGTQAKPFPYPLPNIFIQDAWTNFSSQQIVYGINAYRIMQTVCEQRVYGCDLATVTERQHSELTYDTWGSNITVTETSFQNPHPIPNQATQPGEVQISGVIKQLTYEYMNRDLSTTVPYSLPTAVAMGPGDFPYSTTPTYEWAWWVTRNLTSVAATTLDSIVKRKRSYTYDNNGMPLTITDGDANTSLTRTMTYDAYGNCITDQDASGATVTRQYEQTYYTFLNQITLPPANAPSLSAQTPMTTQYSTDYKTGRVTSQTDASGLTTTYTIDSLGRVAAVSVPAPAPATSAFLLKQTQYPVDAITAHTGNITNTVATDWAGNTAVNLTSYDAWGRCISSIVEVPAGTSSTRLITTTTFDSRNNAITKSFPTEITYSGPASYRQRQFDVWGRVIRESVMLAHQSNLLPPPAAPPPPPPPPQSGPPSPTQESLVQTHTWKLSFQCLTQMAGSPDVLTCYANYNGRQCVMSRTVNPSGPNTEVTAWSYDALGRMIGVTDPARVVTTLTLDAFDRVTSRKVTDPVVGVVVNETITYDDVHRTETRKDGAGFSHTTTRDALGRTILQQNGTAVNPNGTVATPDMLHYSFAWDSPGDLGRLGSVTASDGTKHVFTHDIYGNETGLTVTLDGQNYSFARTFMPTGQIATETFPNKAVQTNQYLKGALQQSSLTQPGLPGMNAQTASVSYTMQFTQCDKAVKETFGNGQWDTYVYNALDQIVQSPTEPGIAYGPLGDPTYIGPNSLQYDNNQRLIGLNSPMFNTYYYSYNAGDLVSKSCYNSPGAAPSLTATYTCKAHRVTEYTATGASPLTGNFGYDNNGNMNSAQWSPGSGANWSQTFTYDSLDRMISCAAAPATPFPAGQRDTVTLTMTAAYDYTGRRVRKQIAAADNTRNYILRTITPNYEVMEFPNAQGSYTGTTVKQVTNYLAGVNGYSAMIVDSTQPTNVNVRAMLHGGVFYFSKDHLGSTLGFGNDQCAISPYGEIDQQHGDSRINLRRLFNGQEYDDETGLYYFKSRYYHPVLCRFIQADNRCGGAFNDSDAYNFYAFALNRPMTFIDPSGHFSWAALGMAILDAVVIVVGALCMPACPPLAGFLIGVGVSGMTYDITVMVKHQNFSWEMWGIEGAIGGLMGFLSGGASSAGEAAIAELTVEEVAPNIIVRVGIQAVLGATAGVTGGVTGQVIQNAANGVSLSTGLGQAAWMGAAIGGGTGGLGGISGGSSSSEAADAAIDIGDSADAAKPSTFTRIYTSIKGNVGNLKDWAVENGTAISNQLGPDGRSLIIAAGKVVGKSTWYSIRSDPWN
jgi:RHS repeat-associated protein